MYIFVFQKLIRKSGKINKSGNRCDRVGQGISDLLCELITQEFQLSRNLVSII